MGECIVEEWLRSLQLVQYTQAFLDNGYDDLEVCKQIGDLDLDAIGVEKTGHREQILDAVQVMREQGGTAVYFTLESLDYEDPNALLDYQTVPNPCSPQLYDDLEDPGAGVVPVLPGLVHRDRPLPTPPGLTNGDIQPRKESKPLVTFPKLQLTSIVRDKLAEDHINLADQPYITQDGSEEIGRLQEIADLYASQLHTHPEDVLERLQELQKWGLSCSDSPESEREGSPIRNIYGLFSIYGQSSRSVPPPLPSCPPPSSTYADPADLEKEGLYGSASPSPRHAQIVPVPDEEYGEDETAENKRKGHTSTLGRFFKNVGIRRSGRRYTYKKHQGDLNASDITMSDDDRIQLMIMVKEGKLSMHDAVEVVKQYENQRHHDPDDDVEDAEHEFQFLRNKSIEGEKSSDISTDISEEALFLGLCGYTEDNSSSSSSPGLARSPNAVTRSRSAEAAATNTPSPSSRKKTVDCKGFRSPKLLSSPAASPTKQGKKASRGDGASPKEKKRSLFSSPFVRRKGSRDGSKEREKKSGRLVLESFVSPLIQRKSCDSSVCGGGLRRGSTSSCHTHSPLPPSRPLPRTPCPDCPRTTDPLQAGQLKERRSQSYQGYHCDTQLTGCTAAHTRTVAKSISLQESRQSYEDLDLICLNSSQVSADSLCQSPQERVSSQQTVAIVHRSDVQEDTETETDTLTPRSVVKRHTPPSSTPPESQSPKRQHIVVGAPPGEQRENCSTSAPDQGTSKENGDIALDTSPTGTLDSEDLKESRFGSSSTMSVGSEASPTMDRKKVRSVLEKITKFTHRNRRGSLSTGDECLSSDYEEEDHVNASPRRGSVEAFSRGGTARASLSEKMKEFRKDMKKRLSTRLKLSPSLDLFDESGAGPDAASVGTGHGDKATGGITSSSQESVTGMHVISSSSSHSSSMSIEEEPALHKGPFVARGRVKSDYTPSPYDRDALAIRKGEIIHIINMNESGLWQGVLNKRVGHFKFIYVDVLPLEEPRVATRQRAGRSRRGQSKRPRPKTVQELLQRLGLQDLSSTFLLNGYETLELFSELEEDDLDELQITDPQHRAKLITAAQILHDLEEVPDSPELTDTSGASSHSPVTMPCESPHHGEGGKKPDHTKCGMSGQSTVHMYDDFSFTETDGIKRTNTDSGIQSHRSSGEREGICDANLADFPQEYHEIISVHQNGDISISRPSDGTVYEGNFQKQNSSTLSSLVATSEVKVEPSRNNGTVESTCSPPISPLKMQKSPSPSPSYKSKKNLDIIGVYGGSHSSPSSPDIQVRDASTQHGGGLKRGKAHESGAKDNLLSSTYVLQTKVRTARVRQLSPQGKLPSLRSSSLTPPHSRSARVPVGVATTSTASPKSQRSWGIKKKNPVVSPSKSASASQGLVTAVKTKLTQDNIDLTALPYSTKNGHCGVPTALVQRYAEELCTDVRVMANAMEDARVAELTHKHRKSVYNKSLGDACLSPAIEIRPQSLREFMVFIGLSMYTDHLIRNRITTVDALRSLNAAKLSSKCGMTNKDHIKRLELAIDTLKSFLPATSQETNDGAGRKPASNDSPQTQRTPGKISKFKDKV